MPLPIEAGLATRLFSKFSSRLIIWQSFQFFHQGLENKGVVCPSFPDFCVSYRYILCTSSFGGGNKKSRSEFAEALYFRGGFAAIPTFFLNLYRSINFSKGKTVDPKSPRPWTLPPHVWYQINRLGLQNAHAFIQFFENRLPDPDISMFPNFYVVRKIRLAYISQTVTPTITCLVSN